MCHFIFVNPNPFIMPNRLTGAPYLALGNYAIYAYLICITHVPYILNYTTLDFICQALFFTISIPTATPAANEPKQDNRIIISYFHPKYIP